MTTQAQEALPERLQEEPLKVACIVLAAGSSKRFGSDKRQARLPDGRKLLDAALASIPDIFCQRVLVLHPGDEALAAVYQQTWQPVIAETATAGMGHSLASAIRALQPCNGVLVALADMPSVRAETFKAVARALANDRMVVPAFAGKRGNPVAIGAGFFAELLSPQGDSGARKLIEEHADAVIWLDCEDPGILRDIDTPEDCRKP